MPRINAPKCPHPKCGATMTRCYVRSGGSRGRFLPVGWWCRECGETIGETITVHQTDRKAPMGHTEAL